MVEGRTVVNHMRGVQKDGEQNFHRRTPTSTLIRSLLNRNCNKEEEVSKEKPFVLHLMLWGSVVSDDVSFYL